MTDFVNAELSGQVGCITLNRPKALNALNLPMVRAITAALLAWRDDAAVHAVAIRGSDKHGAFGNFCAGGDIRFFHAAALAGHPELEDFFTEEYALNHLIQTYPKPVIAFMDGIVMGGGMGLAQGASLRIVTERSKLAMPETLIGLFPDVGGGHFLSRCPGHLGEWLALTGSTLNSTEAIAAGLADHPMAVNQMPAAWAALASLDFAGDQTLKKWIAHFSIAVCPGSTWSAADIDHFFALPDVRDMIALLEAAAGNSAWAAHTATLLRQRSPLMLHVTLEQVRRARTMTLADALRMERDLVRHCFHQRPGVASETVEGIRALAVDKDHAPRWNPGRIEDVQAADVAAFFASPWPAHAHPLRGLA